MQTETDHNTCRKLIVFGDVHYASYWDYVAEVLTDWEDVINPNAELARFLVQRAAETSPFAAVNLGDAIDYFLCDYEAGHIDGRAHHSAPSRAKLKRFSESVRETVK